MWKIWLIAAGIFFIGEIVTVGFLIFWLGIGALIAMGVSFLTDNLLIQTATFVISSTILMFATKPFIKKIANNKETVKTNVYSIIGKTAIVTKDINSIDSTGQIKVAGETWSAIAADEKNIEEGTKVEIVEIKGVKAIVKPLEEEIFN